MFANLILLAITLSVDSFSVGITYGIRNTKISLAAKFVLFFISFFVLSFSLMIGNVLLHFLPTSFISVLGSLLLCFMGIWLIYQSFQPVVSSVDIAHSTLKSKQFFIKPLGITIKIIKDPIFSDFDHSKTIDIKEAFYLGLAMSVDSFVAGMGVSMIGNFSFLLPLLVAVFQFIFLSLGDYLGKKLKSISNLSPNFWNRFAGVLLILLGILKA